MTSTDSTNSITLYIPRVKLTHSSRDIRIIFLQQEIGSHVSVDVAYNPHTRYNMVFVTIKEPLNDKIKKIKDILTQYSNIKLYPDGASNEFWMLFPSKCDHEKEEEDLLKQPSNSHMSVHGTCKCGSQVCGGNTFAFGAFHDACGKLSDMINLKINDKLHILISRVDTIHDLKLEISSVTGVYPRHMFFNEKELNGGCIADYGISNNDILIVT
jgi:hypothetical protein